jgi:PKD repeat protein
MKKSIVVLMQVFFASLIYAQDFNIYGSLVDSSGNAVAGQTVYIYSDSSFNYSGAVQTDALGIFMETIPGGAPLGPNIVYFIYTNDNCTPSGTAQTTVSTQQGTINNATVTLNVCTAGGGNQTSCTSSFYGYSPGNDLNYIFHNLSSGSGLSFLWTFEDSTSSNLENPTHTFPSNGNFMVCLTVSDGLCSDILCQSLIIGNPNCQAQFYAYLDTVSNIIYLIELSTSPNNLTSYHWDFGDGNTSSVQYPSHTYANYGYYSVCLTVTDSIGCTSTTCDSVGFFPFVGGESRSGFVLNVIPPSTLSSQEFENLDIELRLFPNPANESVKLDWMEGKMESVQLIDPTGKLHMQFLEVDPGLSIDIRSLPNGIYFFRLMKDGNVSHVRFVKSN